MKRNGKRIVAGNSKAGGKDCFSVRLILSGHKTVKSDFTDADEKGIIKRSLNRFSQRCDIALIHLRYVKRMNAEKIPKAMHAGEALRRRPILRGARRKQHCVDAGFTRRKKLATLPLSALNGIQSVEQLKVAVRINEARTERSVALRWLSQLAHKPGSAAPFF